METKPQDLTVRGEHTSASNAEADLRCKARFLAQRGYPDTKTEDAEYGTKIHTALKEQSREGLDLSQEKTYDLCNEVEDRAVTHFFPEANGAKSIPTREARYWIKWQDGLMHSGQLDSVHLLRTRALIVEYKTLPGEVPASSKNLQLRDQACLLAYNVPALEEIAVMVIQPMVTLTPEITVYNKENIAQASAEMYFRVRASNTPNQLRTPGDIQCKYCLASKDCKEYNQFAGGMVVLPDTQAATSLLNVPITQWTPEMQALFLDRMAIAQKWLDDSKATLKALMKIKPDAVPGYTLRAGRNIPTIVNAEAVYARFQAAGGTLEQFMKCVEVGKQKLELAVRTATKLKGKAAEAKLTEVIGNDVTNTVADSSIVKVKK